MSQRFFATFVLALFFISSNASAQQSETVEQILKGQPVDVKEHQEIFGLRHGNHCKAVMNSILLTQKYIVYVISFTEHGSNGNCNVPYLFMGDGYKFLSTLETPSGTHKLYRVYFEDGSIAGWAKEGKYYLAFERNNASELDAAQALFNESGKRTYEAFQNIGRTRSDRSYYGPSFEALSAMFQKQDQFRIEQVEAQRLEQYRKAFGASINSSELKSFIATYEKNDPDGLIPSAKEKLIEAEQREAAEAIEIYRNAFKNAQSSSDFDNFINTYSGKDPDNLIPKAEVMKQTAIKREIAEENARQLQIYRDAFKNALSSSDFDNFISTYRGKDPDKLIPKAEAKKRVALAQERKEAERQRREEQVALAKERKEAERQRREEQKVAERQRREEKHACDRLYIGKPVSYSHEVSWAWHTETRTCHGVIIGIGNGMASAKLDDDCGFIKERNCSSW